MATLLYTIRNHLRNHKLTQDIAWTLGSFFVLAISGIVINIAIIIIRDASALGVFNLSYAVYIVISQLAVWGIHYSVLRYAAYYKENPSERGSMLKTAGVIALGMGCLFAVITILAEQFFAYAFSSKSVGKAIRWAALGLIFFPLNKVLMAYINGMREMKAFSILQGLRYLTVMVVVILIASTDVEDGLMSIAFLIAEIIAVIGGLSYIIHRRLVGVAKLSMRWMREHFIFGTKGLMGGMFAEVNSRVDVLLIGFFLTDKATGIYSFAAMLVDGLYHILAVIRINFNPILVAIVRDGDWEKARLLRQQSRQYVLPIVFLCSLGLTMFYYVLTIWIVPEKELAAGLLSLLILLSGLNIICVFIPFDNLMMISGHPAYQAAQQMLAVTVNALVAVVLLPILGIEGAALGTAFSYICGICFLTIFTHRLLGWRLIANVTPSIK